MSGLKESWKQLAEEIQTNADAADVKLRKAILEKRGHNDVFKSRDESLITGRPHHLIPWQAGIETKLGPRRW